MWWVERAWLNFFRRGAAAGSRVGCLEARRSITRCCSTATAACMRCPCYVQLLRPGLAPFHCFHVHLQAYHTFVIVTRPDLQFDVYQASPQHMRNAFCAALT